MTKSLTVFLQSVDICTPGLTSWQEAVSVFKQQASFQPENQAVPKADILSPREKRRASDTVNLSLHLAGNAQQAAKIDPKILRTVFATSDGDNDIFDYLCQELAEPEPAISPTTFHQSLHNSAAGYWGIVTKSHASSLSLSAEDHTFASGLLTAATEVVTTKEPSLFVAYNLPEKGPMQACNPILTWFGTSAVLKAEQDETTLAKLSIELVSRETATSLETPALDELYHGNPIARALPLLEVLATKKDNTVLIDYLDPFSLKIDVEHLK